jgi:rhodanese-related sulfurtransferase
MRTGQARMGAIALISIMLLSLQGAQAQSQVDILPGQPSVAFTFGGQDIVVSRNQDSAAVLPREFSRVARACPPHCIEPSQAAPGVRTLTELDVLEFMQNSVTGGSGLMVDSRLPADYAGGSLPGAISVPSATLVSDNPYREDLLLALGATGSMGALDFSKAFDLLIFDAGPWSPVAREAIVRLLAAGYPAQKLTYYRGGLQMWHLFGLTVTQ